MAEVTPVVDGILARASRTSAAVRESSGDVRAEVLARLWHKLHGGSDEGEPVARLRDYAAAVTHNCIHDVLRAQNPRRARLKNRIRVLMVSDERFASWVAGGATLCGRAVWQGRDVTAEPALARHLIPPAVFDQSRPAEAILALFTMVGAPLEIDALVSWLMDLWNIAEETTVDVETIGLEDVRPTPLASLETRTFLESLWQEIGILPPLQRSALLLNLRDHEAGNALTLFLLLGIAEFDRIAATIGVTAEDLGRLWCSLPLDDATIADRLGLRRQQVINLRKSARERLRRRLQR